MHVWRIFSRFVAVELLCNIYFQLLHCSDHQLIVLKISEHFYIHYYIPGKFQKYDHGSSENVHIYGSETPPEYDLSKITTKIHLIYGGNDWLIPPKVSNHSISIQIFRETYKINPQFQSYLTEYEIACSTFE